MDNSNRLFKLTGLTEPLFVQVCAMIVAMCLVFALDPLKHGNFADWGFGCLYQYSFHALLSFPLLVKPLYHVSNNVSVNV